MNKQIDLHNAEQVRSMFLEKLIKNITEKSITEWNKGEMQGNYGHSYGYNESVRIVNYVSTIGRIIIHIDQVCATITQSSPEYGVIRCETTENKHESWQILLYNILQLKEWFIWTAHSNKDAIKNLIDYFSPSEKKTQVENEQEKYNELEQLLKE